MSLEYKPSLGFVETAGLVIAIQVADAMAKAAEVEIISAHKVDGLRVCVICKGDVAACQAAVETGALLAQSLNGLNGYNIIPSPAEEPDSLMDMLEDIKRKKAARKAAEELSAARKAASVLADRSVSTSPVAPRCTGMSIRSSRAIPFTSSLPQTAALLSGKGGSSTAADWPHRSMHFSRVASFSKVCRSNALPRGQNACCPPQGILVTIFPTTCAMWGNTSNA